MKKALLILSLLLILSSCWVKQEVIVNNDITSTWTLVESSWSITQTWGTSTWETNTWVVEENTQNSYEKISKILWNFKLYERWYIEINWKQYFSEVNWCFYEDKNIDSTVVTDTSELSVWDVRDRLGIVYHNNLDSIEQFGIPSSYCNLKWYYTISNWEKSKLKEVIINSKWTDSNSVKLSDLDIPEGLTKVVFDYDWWFNVIWNVSQKPINKECRPISCIINSKGYIANSKEIDENKYTKEWVLSSDWETLTRIVDETNYDQDFTSDFAKIHKVIDKKNWFYYTFTSNTGYYLDWKTLVDETMKISYTKKWDIYSFNCIWNKEETKKYCKQHQIERMQWLNLSEDRWGPSTINWQKFLYWVGDIYVWKYDWKKQWMDWFESTNNAWFYIDWIFWKSDMILNSNSNSMFIAIPWQDRAGWVHWYEVSVLWIKSWNPRMILKEERLWKSSYKLTWILNTKDCKTIDVLDPFYNSLEWEPYLLKKYKIWDSSFEYNISPKYENITQWENNKYTFRCGLGNNLYDNYEISIYDK